MIKFLVYAVVVMAMLSSTSALYRTNPSDASNKERFCTVQGWLCDQYCCLFLVITIDVLLSGGKVVDFQMRNAAGTPFAVNIAAPMKVPVF